MKFRTFLLTLAALGLQAAELTGYISDAACGWNNARPGKEAKECAQRCVKGGWAPVFIRDGDTTVYKIKDKARVMEFVGEHVTITGTLAKEQLNFTTIRKSEPKPISK